MIVTGASGLLGSALCGARPGGFSVAGTFWNHPVEIAGVELFKVNLADEDAADTIARRSPAAILHCAALTQVDYCETHPDEAYRHNVLATRSVARAARLSGAYLIHISTDGVFSGNKGHYREEDVPDPVSVYARTKLESEGVALGEAPGSLVARTTIYGWNAIPKLSLAEWILGELRKGKEVPGFVDAIFSPLFTGDLAGILWELCRKRPAGLLHVGSRESCSKYEFARQIASLYGFDPARVRESRLSDAALIARRPADVSMVVAKAEGVLGSRLPGVREGLTAFKQAEARKGQTIERQAA